MWAGQLGFFLNLSLSACPALVPASLAAPASTRPRAHASAGMLIVNPRLVPVPASARVPALGVGVEPPPAPAGAKDATTIPAFPIPASRLTTRLSDPAGV